MSSIEMASPVPGAVEIADSDRGLGVMDWLRNTRPGQLLANVSMSAAVILPGGGIATAALAEAPPAMAADTEPILTDSQKQECIDEGLVMPAINKAFVVHPGRRPYSGRNPSKPGAIQKTNLSVKYPEVSQECDDDVLRMGLAILQKEVGHNKWRNPFIGSGRIAFGYRSNREGLAGVGRIESGDNSADWYFLKPGERERLILKEIVVDPQTGQILDTQKDIVPVKIRWGSSGANVSAIESSSSDLKQECIDVALAKPKIVKALVLNAGQFEPEPKQRFSLSTRYQPWPEECKGFYARGNKVKVQAWHDGEWQNVTYWRGISINRYTNGGNWFDLGNERGVDFPICSARMLLQATMGDLSVDTGELWVPHPVVAKRKFAPVPAKLLPRRPKAC